MTVKPKFSNRLRRAGVGLILGCLLLVSPVLAAAPGVLIKTAFPAGSFPAGLLYGPQGKYWLPLAGVGAVAEWGPADALPLAHSLGDVSARPHAITIGPDYGLWITEKTAGKIVRYDLDGTVTKFSLPDPLSQPSHLVSAQDGTLWFTEFNHNVVGRMSMDGDLVEYPLPSPNSKPLGITSDLQGNVWFTEWNGYRIGRFALDGTLTEYTLLLPPSRPAQIMLGPDSALWFTYELYKQVGRIDPLSGSITNYPLPTASSSITSMAVGADGNVWFLGTQTVGSFEVTPTGPANLTETALPNTIFEGQGGNQIAAGPGGQMTFVTANTQNIYEAAPVTPAMRDLQVFILDHPEFLLAGGPFTMDVRLANWSNDPANLTLTLDLSEGIEFVSAPSAQVSCTTVDAATVECTNPAFPGNTVSDVTFTLNATRRAVREEPALLDFHVAGLEGDYLPANNRSFRTMNVLREYVYQTGFDGGADGFWSPGDLGTVNQQDALGLFDNHQAALELPKMPPHDSASMCFDLYILGGWDGSSLVDPQASGDPPVFIGPDLWAYYMNDVRVLVSSFSNQAGFPQAFPGDYADKEYEPQTGAAETGEFDASPDILDARYRICTTQTHRLAQFLMTFYGLNLDGSSAEKWALDNVIVRLYYRNVFDYVYLPFLAK